MTTLTKEELEKLVAVARIVKRAGHSLDEETRALITPAQHDALAAHVAAEVAKARAEDAAKIAQLEERVVFTERWADQQTKKANAALAKIGAKP